MTRFYAWRGELYPSVTSILQVVAKPNLVQWAARCVAEAAVAEAHIVARQAAADPAGAISRLSGAPWRKRDNAAAVGTLLHKAAEAIAVNGSVDIPPNADGYVRQLMMFVQKVRPRFLLTEASVYSRRHKYAGTLDAIAQFPDGDVVMLDYKTSKDIYPEYILQLAAYRFADFIGDGDEEKKLPDVDRACIIHLTKDGYRLVEVDADKAAFESFLAARRLFAWLTDHRAALS